jgi:HlyD family secretion protein
MEQKQIFRKAAIDRVASPEQLTDYIQVGSPSVWVTLTAVIILLASLFVWAAFGQVEVNRTDANGTVYTETVKPIEFIFGK